MDLPSRRLQGRGLNNTKNMNGCHGHRIEQDVTRIIGWLMPPFFIV